MARSGRSKDAHELPTRRAASDVLSSSSPPQGLPDRTSLGNRNRCLRAGQRWEWNREVRAAVGWGGAGGGTESAPVDDVTGWPPAPPPRPRRFAHLPGASPLARHDGSAGTGSRLRECRSPTLVLFSCLSGIFFSVPSTWPLPLLDFAGRARVRGSV